MLKYRYPLFCLPEFYCRICPEFIYWFSSFIWHHLLSHKPFEIAFVLLPMFNMMALTSAIEPLRVCNLLSEKKQYRWILISLDGKQVEASNGMYLNAENSISDEVDFDIVFVCASWKPEVYDDKRFFHGYVIMIIKGKSLVQSIRALSCWHEQNYLKAIEQQLITTF